MVFSLLEFTKSVEDMLFKKNKKIELQTKSHISANKKTVSKPNATVLHHYINPISKRKMDLIFI